MKRMNMAIAILILIPVFIFSTHFYMKKATDNMGDILSKAEQLELKDESKQTADEIEAFEKQWDFHKVVMATFVRHSELDVVNLSAAKLKPLLQNGDKGEFNAECETLRYQLHHLWDSERFSIDNVL